MIIQEIKQSLLVSSHPVAKVIFLKEHFKVLAIGFLKDMILKDHKTPYTSKLLIIEGAVMYKELEKEIELVQYDEYLIPSNVIHSLTAMEDALCFLIQA